MTLLLCGYAQNDNMSLTRTQWGLLRFALKALPVAAALGGALFGYFEVYDMGHHILATIQGIEAKQSAAGIPWYIVLENVAIGTVLGFTSGIVLSSFGLIFSDFMTVVEDPVIRYPRSEDNTVYGPTSNKTYYKKHDVKDHERSTQKIAEKYEDLRQKEAEEIQEILEIGTEGIREKKLGKKVEEKKTESDKKAENDPKTEEGDEKTESA